MFRVKLLSAFFLLAGCSFLIAQDENKLQSGPKVDEVVPASFQAFNVNGPAKGRPSCLVCRFALLPAVLIFAKEPAEGKDDALNDLLKKLDDTATEFQDRAFSVGVVFLSPDARDSTTNPDVEKDKEIIKEAIDREKLHERLSKRAEKYKHVIVACYGPEGPKQFKLNPKADVTVLFYERLKVHENWAFGPDSLHAKDVAGIEKKVRDTLSVKKKKG